MRHRLFCIALLAGAVLLVSSPVSADSICLAGSVCTVQLTGSNVVQLAGVQVNVTINNQGPHTILSFQLFHNPLTNTPLGIDQIGWNAAIVQVGTTTKSQGPHKPPLIIPVYGPNPLALSSSSTNFGGYQATTINGSGTMSAFGTFNVEAQDPAGIGGVTLPIIFTLHGLVTNFPSNLIGNDFVVHMRFNNSCSGWIGGPAGAHPSSVGSNLNCTPRPPQVPEPNSLVLLGSGLLIAAGILRRRLSL